MSAKYPNLNDESLETVVDQVLEFVGEEPVEKVGIFVIYNEDEHSEEMDSMLVNQFDGKTKVNVVVQFVNAFFPETPYFGRLELDGEELAFEDIEF